MSRYGRSLPFVLLVGCGQPPALQTEPAAEQPSLLDQARASLDEGTDVGAVLSDPEYASLHPLTEFRELIREHASAGLLTIVEDREPGTRILARGTVVDSEDRPLDGLLVYVYQTDDRGWYAADAPHVEGFAGDARHARLFGYLKTDTHGTFEIRTIKPVGYPRTDLPAHIHVELFEGETELAVTEMLFPDDERLTTDREAEARRIGFVVSTIEAVGVYSAKFVAAR